MKKLASLLAQGRVSREIVQCRPLFCEVIDVDLGGGYGDLTIRCLAKFDGEVEILDLMFGSTGVRILESAMAGIRVATCSVAKSSGIDSTACSDRLRRHTDEPGTHRSAGT